MSQDHLSDLSIEINEAHAQASNAAVTALEHARRCGELLLLAKEQLPYGMFLCWLAEHCQQVRERQARNYMRLASHWPAVVAKRQRAADMTIRQAMRLIAAPAASQPSSAVPTTPPPPPAPPGGWPDEPAAPATELDQQADWLTPAAGDDDDERPSCETVARNRIFLFVSLLPRLIDSIELTDQSGSERLASLLRLLDEQLTAYAHQL